MQEIHGRKDLFPQSVCCPLSVHKLCLLLVKASYYNHCTGNGLKHSPLHPTCESIVQPFWRQGSSMTKACSRLACRQLISGTIETGPQKPCCNVLLFIVTLQAPGKRLPAGNTCYTLLRLCRKLDVAKFATSHTLVPQLPYTPVMNLFLPLLTAISAAGSPNCSSLGCGSLSTLGILGASSSTVGRKTEEPPMEESMD